MSRGRRRGKLQGACSQGTRKVTTVEIESNPASRLVGLGPESSRCNGERYVLIVRWERPRFHSVFGETPLRYARYGALLFTALVFFGFLQSILRAYREITPGPLQRFADGDLSTRVADNWAAP